MPGWTLLDTQPSQGRTFHRPLDVAENWFLWGSLCDGASDCILRVELCLNDSGAKDLKLFSEANIVQAWLSTKRRYPLVGATLQRPPGSTPDEAESKTGILGIAAQPHFVVRESELAVLRPREIVFGRVESREQVHRWRAEVYDEPRPLSQDLLTQLYVFRETGKDDVLHVAILLMHCVTDITAASGVLRCFLDTLARGGGPEPAQVPLEDRLAMVTALPEREPIQLRSLSPARRRWRNAAASIIFQARMEKMQGGHTLPCRLTPSTTFTPSRSRESFVFLTPAETATVLANCRRHKVTFGNAYLALAQVAMTRVLYRRFLRGDMSEEEWEYRKEQPHIIAGPFSLRPYLDKTWFEQGGAGECNASLGTFFYKLPFMTLGETAGRYQPRSPNLGLSSGAPPFSELLTFERFLHRAELMKKQGAAFFKHPLFLEIVHASDAFILQYLERTTLEWLERNEAAKDGELDEDEEALTPMDVPMAVAHGGSSFGNLGSVLPLEYPLPPTHPLSPFSSVSHPFKAGYVQLPSATSTTLETDHSAPTMVVHDATTIYHTRPGEVYLGAWSLAGRLKMYGLYDNNAFEEAVVKEWLDEIKGAVLWYLGQTHDPRQGKQNGNGTGKFETELEKGGQAKL